jgi:hypothetical protein
VPDPLHCLRALDSTDASSELYDLYYAQRAVADRAFWEAIRSLPADARASISRLMYADRNSYMQLMLLGAANDMAVQSGTSDVMTLEIGERDGGEVRGDGW